RMPQSFDHLPFQLVHIAPFQKSTRGGWRIEQRAAVGLGDRIPRIPQGNQQSGEHLEVRVLIAEVLSVIPKRSRKGRILAQVHEQRYETLSVDRDRSGRAVSQLGVVLHQALPVVGRIYQQGIFRQPMGKQLGDKPVNRPVHCPVAAPHQVSLILAQILVYRQFYGWSFEGQRFAGRIFALIRMMHPLLVEIDESAPRPRHYRSQSLQGVEISEIIGLAVNIIFLVYIAQLIAIYAIVEDPVSERVDVNGFESGSFGKLPYRWLFACEAVRYERLRQIGGLQTALEDKSREMGAVAVRDRRAIVDQTQLFEQS